MIIQEVVIHPPLQGTSFKLRSSQHIGFGVQIQHIIVKHLFPL